MTLPALSPIIRLWAGAIFDNPDARVGTDMLLVQGTAEFPSRQLKRALLRAL